ncbi:Ferric siderophore transport system, biopolymer transport protein ExbB [Caenispirillum salinarum AK4]|uniref:Ferric siderophore transport system, biopolymer transport protein ExbB n=1 Tax=Caenispirillum salinarum AK4 TaxID=1238182 RepID=K9H5B4_9PROT|nr:MotA/TolQ/ExbB proton channel family protein [Caenispirillum salinarum]EKV32274.1 Ferric siderophore transport system, biopolymer transport protein ExbB [Caenispirillum salinarum AK4]
MPDALSPPAGAETAGAPPLAEAAPGSLAGLLEIVQAGGPIMLVLAVLSAVTLIVVLAKLAQFAHRRLWARRAVDRALELWHAGRVDEAPPVLEAERTPVAEVLLVALRTRLDPHMTPAQAREEAARIAGLHLDQLGRGLRLLAVIASLSPLLGLLGTVIGMIGAFQALETAGSKVDPSILSGGIWVALLTTAAGLVVAIPAAAAHQWLEGMVERTGRTMEDAATQVFTRQPAADFRHREAPAAPQRFALQPAE